MMWESASWSCGRGPRRRGQRYQEHEGETRCRVNRDLRRYFPERNKETEQVSNSIFQIQRQRESENESLMQADGLLPEKKNVWGKGGGERLPAQKRDRERQRQIRGQGEK